MKIQINSFEELLQVIEDRQFSSNQICELVAKALKIYGDASSSREQLLLNLENYWDEWSDEDEVQERPLFFD